MSGDLNHRRPIEELPEEDLIALSRERRDRDDRPFAELFRRHRGFVWRSCIGFIGNPQDAEDLTQDVFFAAYKKLDQFRGDSSFRTWLHRIAMNTCKNEVRRRSRRLRTVDEGLEETAAATVSGAPGPEAAIAGGRRLQRLAAAIAALRPPERKILRLADVEQRPYNEIAEELGLSLGAVKMRVMRARLSLRGAFQTLEGQGGT